MPRFQCVPAKLPILNGFRGQSAVQAAGHGSANWVPTRFPPGSCNLSPRHAVAGVSYCSIPSATYSLRYNFSGIGNPRSRKPVPSNLTCAAESCSRILIAFRRRVRCASTASTSPSARWPRKTALPSASPAGEAWINAKSNSRLNSPSAQQPCRVVSVLTASQKGCRRYQPQISPNLAGGLPQRPSCFRAIFAVVAGPPKAQFQGFRSNVGLYQCDPAGALRSQHLTRFSTNRSHLHLRPCGAKYHLARRPRPPLQEDPSHEPPNLFLRKLLCIPRFFWRLGRCIARLL